MNHPSHKLKAYTADQFKPLVFCELCGKEETEGLSEPCTKKFYTEKVVDTITQAKYPKFVSGLPEY
jgi:hypothetical protein